MSTQPILMTPGRAVQRCIRAVDALAAQALLDADPPTRRLRMRIRLNVDDGDVRQALLVRPSPCCCWAGWCVTSSALCCTLKHHSAAEHQHH
jgi:hypothetical protein